MTLLGFSRRHLSVALLLCLGGWASAGEVRRLEADGHPTYADDVVVSRDGRFALSTGPADDDDNAQVWRLWDMATGREVRVVRRFAEKSGRNVWVLFTPDGRHVVEYGQDEKLRLWDVESGKEVRQFEGHKQRVERAVVSPDGRRLVSSGQDHTIRLWDVETGKELRQFDGHENEVTSLALSADGKHLLTGNGPQDKLVRVWDVETGKKQGELRGDAFQRADLALSPDGRSVLTVSDGGLAQRWDVETGKELAKWTVPAGVLPRVSVAAFSDDGKRFLVAGTAGKAPVPFLTVCDAETGKPLAHAFRLEKKPESDTDFEIDELHVGGNVSDAFFSADGKRILYTLGDGRRGGGEGAGALDAETGKTVRHFHVVRFEPGPGRSIAVSPDGKTAVSGHRGFLQLWDVTTGRELTRWRTDKVAFEIRGVAFSPDGKTVLSGDESGNVRLWRLDEKTGKGQLVRTFSGHKGAVRSLAFSPDGRRFLSAGDDGVLRLWDVSGKEVGQCAGHKGAINSAAFAADGKRAVTGGADKTVRLWDLEAARETHCLKGHTLWVAGVAISPDGRRILSGSGDGTVRVWSAETGAELGRSEDHTRAVTAVAFSPDGRTLLSGSEDGTIRAFDTQTSKELNGDDAKTPVLAFAIDPDGRHVTAANADSTIRLWGLAK